MNREEELAYLKIIDQVIEKGPYKNHWDSLGHFQIPDWFKDAKFGIFIHWGLYSVAAHANEWYSRNMYLKEYEEWEYHRKTFGEHKDFGYKDFIPMFTADQFNACEWINLFKKAGANYIFPVAEHHDGFMMYNSKISAFNAVEMGPKKDVLKELKQAAEAVNMTFCTSSHRAEHWFFMGHGKEFDSDIKEPLTRGDFYWPAMEEPDNQDLFSNPYPSEEFLEDWLLRTCELVDTYQPALLYFDWWIQHDAFKDVLQKFAAYYYNRGIEWKKKVAICYKHDAMAFGSGIVEIERGKLKDPKPYFWQSDTAIANNSWCYTDTLDYKTSTQILYDLIEVVCKNGNLLLNVGPKGDGSIPDKDKEILEEIGNWMDINKEAIHGTRCWRNASEGPTQIVEGQFTDSGKNKYTSEDIRFTCKGSAIYCFVMNYPKNQKVRIQSLAVSKDQNVPQFHGIIQKVEVLGYTDDVKYDQDEQGLNLTTTNIHSSQPVVVKISVR